MKENDRIKLKTNAIYSLVMLVMIGLLAYYEVLAIKKDFHLLSRWVTGLRSGG